MAQDVSFHLPVVLASASPRRRDFVALLGIPFTACAADVDERNGQGERPADLVARLSREKAAVVRSQQPGAIVIGADTVVALNGDILGKPRDADDAEEMLKRLRGRPHHVYSGVTVCSPHGAPLIAVSDSTVWMRSYSDAEIAAYVASGDPLDKAGAYGIQHAGFHPVARVRGCYASVMGLPLCHLADLMAQAGIGLAVDVPAACRTLTGIPCCSGQEVDLWFNQEEGEREW